MTNTYRISLHEATFRDRQGVPMTPALLVFAAYLNNEVRQ